MLLGEPPRSQWDLHFSLFGIPVRIHPFFWLVGVLLISGELFDRENTPDLRAALVILLPWMSALFIAILVHELGHALAMRAYGFAPWITLYGLGGLTSHNPAATYRSRGAGALGQVLISAAGPGAGFLLAALVVAGVRLSGHGVEVYLVARFLPGVAPAEMIGSEVFTRFVDNLLFISIFWGFINLLPVYPLDGGQIAREILLEVNPRDGIRFSLFLSVFTAAALALVALTQLRSLLMALLFGYLAYMSYMTLQAYRGRGPW